MKIWRINIILRDNGNPPYTAELIRMEFRKIISLNTSDAEMFLMDVREVIPQTFRPLIPKERIERKDET